MRIYEVTFDGREKDGDGWNPNWESENVVVKDGGAVEAIELATKQVRTASAFEVRPASVKILAEAP